MSVYLIAAAAAAVALLALVLIGVRTVATLRRFRRLARAYQRQLAAEAALLDSRRAELATELARRRRHPSRDQPRTMR